MRETACALTRRHIIQQWSKVVSSLFRQFNPVYTYRDKFTLNLKTIIQLTARCGIHVRSNYNLMTIKGLSGIEITVIGACHYAPFYGACYKWAPLFSVSNKKIA